MKKAKRDYLELDLKHSEVSQLLGMLVHDKTMKAQQMEM